MKSLAPNPFAIIFSQNHCTEIKTNTENKTIKKPSWMFIKTKIYHQWFFEKKTIKLTVELKLYKSFTDYMETKYIFVKLV